MATADEYAAWIVKNKSKQGTPEFATVAQAYELAKQEENAARADTTTRPQPAPAEEPGMLQQIAALPETALTLATGGTTGVIGGLGGFLGGLAGALRSGEFGTQEAARKIEQAALEGMQAMTYAPRSQAAQEQVAAIGELAGMLPPVIPAVGAPGALAASIESASPMAQMAASRSAQVAQQVGKATGQAIMKPVKMVSNVAREAVGMEAAPASVVSPSAIGGRVSAGAAATPEALQRVTTAQNLPVPVSLTKGAALRDAEQLAFEKEQMKSALGGPLRQRAEENNVQALQNFDSLLEMTDSQLTDMTATGGSVVKALSDGLAAAKNRTRAAYKAAEKAGELENNVTLGNVVDYINQNIPEGDLAPVLKAARQKALSIGAAIEDANGNLVAQPVTLKQAESLRQTFQRAGFEGADQYHGGTLRKLFDTETDGLGGDLYQKARQTRIDQARKFENRAIVARLVKNRKGMEDPVVASDQVFKKSIIGSSPEEITFLKRVLLTSGEQGQQAWKELQGATIRHIRDEATKGMGMSAGDRPLVSPAKLHQTVRNLDENGKLDLMLGKKNATVVRDLNDVVRYVSTVPPGTLINSSGTAGTVMAAIAEAGATGALTGLPLPVISGLKQIIKLRNEKATKAKINDALNALPTMQP